MILKQAVRRLTLVAALSALGVMSSASLASASAAPGQLDPGDTLYPGQSVVSPNGQWSFEMQADGNLVLYSPYHIAVAETGTSGEPEVVLQMQQDGNLVLRARGNVPIAASATDAYPGTVLQVQNDGAVVLYAPGHAPVQVVVPAADFVNSPMPGQPSDVVDSPRPGPRLDPGAVGGDSTDTEVATRGLACAGGGRAIASKLPRVGQGVGVACGILANDSGQDVDGFAITQLIGCSLTGPLALGCTILTDADPAH